MCIICYYVYLIISKLLVRMLQVNFVGKILGQGGENIRQLQEMTGCRIAVLGKGSMKDKAKVCALCKLTLLL